MIDWEKQFPVAFVSRTDLVEAGIPKELVARLDDAAMGNLAKALGHVYGDHDYWQDFSESVEGIIFLTLTVKQEGAENEVRLP